jgi:hypothetical protein
MALTMTLTGLSSAWFMIGLGRASAIAIYEIAPRIIATIAAAILLVLGGGVVWYPVLLAIAIVLGIAAYASRTLGARDLTSAHVRDVVQVVRSNRTALATEVAAGAYNSLAVSFVGGAASAQQAANYVSGDKLYRIGQYSVSALGNSLQGWVVERGSAQFGRRIRVSLLLHLALGVAGLAGFALLGPWLSAALFGPQVAIDFATALGLGVATLGIALGTSLGRITLIGMGGRRAFLTSVLIGSCVGVPAILVLSSMFGAAGGAWGLALGEAASVIAQAISVAWLRVRIGAFVVNVASDAARG